MKFCRDPHTGTTQIHQKSCFEETYDSGGTRPGESMPDSNYMLVEVSIYKSVVLLAHVLDLSNSTHFNVVFKIN